MTAQDAAPGRTVTLVLCTAADGVLGALPEFDVPAPYWQEVHDVVVTALARYGLDVVVLRLLRGPVGIGAQGGAVTYLAQVDEPPPAPVRGALRRWDGPDPLAEHPSRAPYARVDGPRSDLSWALSVLDAQGLDLVAPPRQVRTWNLSCLWELATGGGRFWLKVVPSFFAHEGLVLQRLRAAGLDVPDVLEAEPGRVLLGEVPGQDHYGAPAERVTEMVPLIVRIQAAAASWLPELEALGVPDGDLALLPARAADLAGRVADELDDDDRRDLDRLVADLPELVAAVTACGLSRTLVHGDFHPGNVRGVPGAYRILDWGDAQVGDPSRDVAQVSQGLDVAGRAAVLTALTAAWRAVVPGCDPRRAGEIAVLLAPIQSALSWQGFLDRIEPDERPYHEGDPAAGLRAAVRVARDQRWRA